MWEYIYIHVYFCVYVQNTKGIFHPRLKVEKAYSILLTAQEVVNNVEKIFDKYCWHKIVY